MHGRRGELLNVVELIHVLTKWKMETANATGTSHRMCALRKSTRGKPPAIGLQR